MRRHVSIFAFLLGAFSAGVAFEAGADQTVYGGHYYYGTTYQSKDAARMTITGLGLGNKLAKANTATCAAHEPDGMKVSDWGYVETDSTTVNTDITHPKDTQHPKGLVWADDDASVYYWTNESDRKYAAIAVRFDYIAYTLKFASTRGGTMPTDIATTYEKLVAIPSPSSAPTGYHFVKWVATSSFDAGFSKDVSAGSSVNGEGFGLAGCHADGSVITLTAQWAANGYSVVCEPNGGSWPADYEPPTTASYDQVFSLSAPHRIGYDFIGWKVTSGLDTETAKWGTGENPSTPITADTRCFNGDKDVSFKNLNPTDNASVTLTAQWQAAKITVTFNNHGGTSGGGLKDTLEVTYGLAYDALNPPTKGGSVFLGYEIGGVPYWNDEGQSVKSVWDIPTNCTADAKWNTLAYQLTYNENRSDGTESKVEIRDFEYGKPTKLYDGAGFSNLGCTLLGWSTNPKASKPDDGCEIGGTAIFVESKTLYAVWEKNYFIAYDGNGATNETPMAVQKLVFGKSGQSLNPNVYGKVGYTFGDWATNRAAALRYEMKFRDKQVLTSDFATTVGETNTLYAIWKTNTYYVAFDMNGGTDVAPDVLRCAYDNPVNLTWTKKDGREFTNGAYDFLGWSNDISKVIYTDRTASVSNLCAIADGTNTLYAVWKLAPLSAAMHCDNLRWESYSYMGRKNKWLPSPDGNGAYQTGAKSTEQQWLLAQVPTNGTLSFSWIPNGCFGDKHLSVFISDNTNTISSITNLTGDGTKWESYTISDIPAEWYVHIYVSETSDMGLCIVDRMTWTPGGREPKDGEDNVTISSAAVSADGKSFSLSFDSKAEFDYNLLTNANLLIKEGWGVMEKKTGTGKEITFKPEIIEGQPQLFYRVDTIQRK